jgi:hypothetical protein
MAFPPNTFATQGGNVNAGQLDANFNACFPISQTGPGLVGLSGGGTGNVGILSASTAYGVLKSAIPWEVTAFMGGVQGGASWQILRYTSTFANIIVSANCVANCGITGTGSTTFTIADNGSTIGTVVFGASSSTGVVSITGSPRTLSAGHILTIIGPVTPDATLANIGITLGGTRG